MTALERQHDGTGFRRLGEVLVEMGFLAEGMLEAVVRRRMEELVGELLAWKGGFFRFEPAGAGHDADTTSHESRGDTEAVSSPHLPSASSCAWTLRARS